MRCNGYPNRTDNHNGLSGWLFQVLFTKVNTTHPETNDAHQLRNSVKRHRCTKRTMHLYWRDLNATIKSPVYYIIYNKEFIRYIWFTQVTHWFCSRHMECGVHSLRNGRQKCTLVKYLHCIEIINYIRSYNSMLRTTFHILTYYIY